MAYVVVVTKAILHVHILKYTLYTVNWVIFVYENIHELNFHVNKFSWVPGPTKIFLHEIFVTLKL